MLLNFSDLIDQNPEPIYFLDLTAPISVVWGKIIIQ